MLDREILFRRRLHKLLEPRPSRYKISDGADAWGIVVTKTNIEGVQVWYAADEGKLTLGLTTPRTQALIPAHAAPEGTVQEVSKTGWRMFRWDVPVLDLKLHPEEQEGTDDLVQKIKDAFDWFNSTRSDISR